MLNFEAGVAVVEIPQMRLRNLEAKVYMECATRLSMSDPRSENTLVPFSASRMRSLFATSTSKSSKNLIYEDTLIGKKIWAAYNYTKSKMVNHWLTLFKIGSREEVDDAVE